jgi:competence protein ComEA
MSAEDPDETRAEVARRRLAQLAAAFEADLPPAEDRAVQVEPEHRSAVLASPVRSALTGTHLRVVGVVAVAAVVVLGWMLLSGRPQAGEPVAPVALSSQTTSSGEPDTAEGAVPAELVVDVVGDVKKPGIVTVPRGSRVFEAVEAAGGLKNTKVDTSGVNMARVLEDGEQVVVGATAEAATGSAAAGAKVRLNQATSEQLEQLPGVGPVTAAAILAWREENGRFATVDDLLDVRGIGDATLAQLRDLVEP